MIFAALNNSSVEYVISYWLVDHQSIILKKNVPWFGHERVKYLQAYLFLTYVKQVNSKHLKECEQSGVNKKRFKSSTSFVICQPSALPPLHLLFCSL